MKIIKVTFCEKMEEDNAYYTLSGNKEFMSVMEEFWQTLINNNDKLERNSHGQLPLTKIYENTFMFDEYIGFEDLLGIVPLGKMYFDSVLNWGIVHPKKMLNLLNEHLKDLDYQLDCEEIEKLDDESADDELDHLDDESDESD